MDDSLDSYTLKVILKNIEIKKMNIHRVPHNSLEYLDGFVDSILWLEDMVRKLEYAQRQKGQ